MQKFFSKLNLFCLSFIHKKMYLNFQKLLKLTKSYFNGDPCHDLNQVIDQDFACENINNMLSIYGLNPNSYSNFLNKSWNHSLIIFFWIGLFKFVIHFLLDPVIHYKLCIYFGDTTLLFEILRTFFISAMVLSHSYGICTNYLFNYDPNNSWFELFKCLDGTLTPASIGIRDTKIVNKMLILAKIVFKLTKLNILVFSVVTMSVCLFLIHLKINFDNNFELIIYLTWMIPISFWVYFLSATIFLSDACFQIICYYCLITIKHYNQLLDNLKIDQSFGLRRLIIKLKIINLIKRQNKFSHRIMKYNKFWCKYFFIMMIHLIPIHILVVQQFLFGNANFLFQAVLMIGSFMTTIVIIISTILSSFLSKEIRNFSKKLIKIHFNRHLNLDIKTKLQVRLSCFVFIKFDLSKCFQVLTTIQSYSQSKVGFYIGFFKMEFIVLFFVR